MMADPASTIHASAVLAGNKAVLIRGPSGAGKSRLALALLQASGMRGIPFARLVADDRAVVLAAAGRLLVAPAPQLAGRIELRGLGIRMLPYESLAAVGLLVDLAAADAQRLPDKAAETASIAGVSLPRLAIAPKTDAFPLILARLTTAASGD